MLLPHATTDADNPGHTAGWLTGQALPLASIFFVAAALRFWAIDSSSLWYDEVVTMRVARSAGPLALFATLDQLDGTRAPLHPLVLQAWLFVWGSSDLAGRSFSALCGLGTVAAIYLLGLRAFDDRTGQWAAWLAALCPPLVYYSQEARMYAWLVFLSTLSWLVFLTFRTSAKPSRCAVYGLLLAALVFSHPLGLFMVAAHGLAFLLVRRFLELPIAWWLAIQAAVVVSIIPWLPRYMDHGTDYPMPRQPIRFLLAVPIEYVGGNALMFAACLALIAVGMRARERAAKGLLRLISFPAENLIFLTWAIAPPVLMYGYSYLSQPIFGPPRYHPFIAPAYLILLAHGLSQWPPAVRWPLAALGAYLSLSLLHHYQPALKADWRGLAAWLEIEKTEAQAGGGAPAPLTIMVHPSDPRFPREQLEAARYYLSPRFQVLPAVEKTRAGIDLPGGPVYDIYCPSTPGNPGVRAPLERGFFGLRAAQRPSTRR
jgi:hypothetical protein